MHDPWDTRYLRSRLPRGLQPERVHLPFDSVPYTQDDLPSVVDYSGFYPLTTVVIIGTQSPGDVSNSILYVAWQRSYPDSGSWLALPSPDPVPVTVQLPPGMIAQQANDLVTRTPVPVYSTKNGRVIVDVAENPVALLAIPAPQ